MASAALPEEEELYLSFAANVDTEDVLARKAPVTTAEEKTDQERNSGMNRYTRRSMLKGAAAALPAAGIFALPSLARGIQENSTPQQRPKVKITDIRTAQVLVHGPQTHVRVYTDSGLYGQGESTDAATRGQ